MVLSPYNVFLSTPQSLLKSAWERHVLRRNCCKLETAVYAIGIILTTTYLVVGLGGVIWFVLCHMEDSEVMTRLKELYLLKMETMMDSLAVR